jgi:RHS repeat-associated protein
MLGVFDDGGLRRCDTSHPPARCVYVGWPELYFAYVRPNFARAFFWHGSLLHDKQDASGTSYRRNRYYDPETGRFTQEDPVGLAGGLNLYGFAGGDPVNFSDPFGLTPCGPLTVLCARAAIFVLGRGIPFAATLGKLAIEALKPGAEPGADELVGTAARAAGALDDASLVVRGGTNTVERIVAGAERMDASGIVHGVSVNSARGASLFDLSSTIPHNQIGVTTVGQIRAAGGTIAPDPIPTNPYHCLVSCITPQSLSDLLRPTIRRPR